MANRLRAGGLGTTDAEVAAIIQATDELGAMAPAVQALISATAASTEAYSRGSHTGTQDAATVTYNGSLLTTLLDTLSRTSNVDVPAVQGNIQTLFTQIASIQNRLSVLEAVAPPTTPPVITAAPTLAFPGGTADIGETATITQGTYSGTAVSARAYQAVYNNVATGPTFGTGTGSTFTLTQAGNVRVVELATYSAGAVSNQSITYTVTDAAPPPVPPVVATQPTLAFTGGGAADVGDTATITQGTYTGGTVTSRTGQVIVNGSVVATVANGATGNTFVVPQSAGAGARSLQYVETALWASTPSVSNASVIYTVNLSAVAPTNTALPTITGGNIIGSIVTGSVGSWNNTPTSYKKQWKLNGANSGALITSSATTTTYDTTSLVDGDVLTLNVIATNGAGDSASSTSAGFTVYADVSGVPDPATIRGLVVDNGDGMITATNNQTISGKWIHTAAGTHGIYIPNGVHDVTITGCEIGPVGTTANTNPDLYMGVYIGEGCYNITVTECVIHDVTSGVVAVRSTNPIIFTKNFVYNVRGPFYHGQMIQFDTVSGGSAASQIKCNVYDGYYGTISGHEDVYSMYFSSGAGSGALRTEIAYNRHRGLSFDHPDGRNSTGSGGMLESSSNFYIHHNTVTQVSNALFGIYDSSNVLFDSNIGYNNHDGGGQKHLASGSSLLVRGAGTNVVVSNNRFYAIDNEWQNGVYIPIENAYATATNNTDPDTTLDASYFNIAPTDCGGSGTPPTGGGGSGGGEITFVGTAVAAYDAALTKPAATAANDIIFLSCICNGPSNSITQPAGFTQIGTNQVTSGGTAALFYKKAGASEPSTYTVTYTDANNLTGCYVYRGADQTTPIDVSAYTIYDADYASPVTVSTPTATTLTNAALVVWLPLLSFSFDGPTISMTAPSGYTVRGTYDNGSFCGASCADLAKATAGATGVISGSCTVSSGTTDVLGWTVALKLA